MLKKEKETSLTHTHFVAIKIQRKTMMKGSKKCK